MWARAGQLEVGEWEPARLHGMVHALHVQRAPRDSGRGDRNHDEPLTCSFGSRGMGQAQPFWDTAHQLTTLMKCRQWGSQEAPLRAPPWAALQKGSRLSCGACRGAGGGLTSAHTSLPCNPHPERWICEMTGVGEGRVWRSVLRVPAGLHCLSSASLTVPAKETNQDVAATDPQMQISDLRTV